MHVKVEEAEFALRGVLVRSHVDCTYLKRTACYVWAYTHEAVVTAKQTDLLLLKVPHAPWSSLLSIVPRHSFALSRMFSKWHSIVCALSWSGFFPQCHHSDVHIVV